MSISKHRIKGLSTILLLLLLVTTLLPVLVFAVELPITTATITVEKILTGDTPLDAETFTFTLTPDDASYPMPGGIDGNTLIIQGAGEASFGAITYSEPGNYIYALKETAGNTANYTYDTTVYKVTAYVTTDDTGNLTAKVWVNKDGSDAKAASAVFTSSYKRPSDPDHPQTGDTTNLPFWIALAGGSATVLLFLLITVSVKKRSSISVNNV